MPWLERVHSLDIVVERCYQVSFKKLLHFNQVNRRPNTKQVKRKNTINANFENTSIFECVKCRKAHLPVINAPMCHGKTNTRLYNDGYLYPLAFTVTASISRTTCCCLFEHFFTQSKAVIQTQWQNTKNHCQLRTNTHIFLVIMIVRLWVGVCNEMLICTNRGAK